MSSSSPDSPLHVYTDGSHLKKHGDLGYGVWFEHEEEEYALSGISTPEFLKEAFDIDEPKVSNPTMEMVALVKALELFEGKSEHIIIYADYNGVQKWVQGEWKAKKPYIVKLRDIARDYISSIEDAGGSVQLEWVAGHSGVHGNEKADEFATMLEPYDSLSRFFGGDAEAPPLPDPEPWSVMAAPTKKDKMALIDSIREKIESGHANRETFDQFVQLLDTGKIRTAEKQKDGTWMVHAWVKQGILLGFRLGEIEKMDFSPQFFDKDTYPLKDIKLSDKIRVVPGGSSIRQGCYVAPSVVCMPPCYINVGAWVGAGTMVDSHALVGSAAQIGERVHLSAGAQIGGVIEPIGAMPVIVEDDAFIGALSGLFEGVLVREKAIIASGVIITGSTPIYDLVNETIIRADENGVIVVPEGAVVIPGTRKVGSDFGSEHGLSIQTPLIVKYREEGGSVGLELESALR